jgi:thioredoxin 1
MAKIVTVNDGNFEAEVLQSDKPVAVLFKTEGCPYCRAMAPVMQQVADEFGDKLKVAFIDAFDSPEMTAEYGIQAVPQLFVFRDGQVLESVLGARPKEEISEKIRTALEQPAPASG